MRMLDSVIGGVRPDFLDKIGERGDLCAPLPARAAFVTRAAACSRAIASGASRVADASTACHTLILTDTVPAASPASCLCLPRHLGSTDAVMMLVTA